MNQDKPVEHDHDFDGIVELDNDLPRWWMGIFWITTAFAICYVPFYHRLFPEKLPEAHLAIQQAERAAAIAEVDAAAPAAEDLEAELQAAYAAGGWQEKAQADFNAFCLACHGPDGGGTIGPNFTDDYYLHGGRLSDIRRIITDGVPAKGMISWKLSLKPQQIDNLTFSIHSLRGTTPATAKAAEGRLVDEAGNFTE